MKKLELTLNKNIEVIWENQVYKSVIQEVHENFFSISIPSKKGAFIPLRQEDIPEVVYYSESNIFQFDSPVIGRKIDGIHLIMLQMPKEYKTVQRRKFFRAATLDASILSDYEKLENKNGKRVKTIKPLQDKLRKSVLIDLSGGGMRAKLDESVAIGDVLHLFLNMPKEELEVYCEVVRIIRNESNFCVCGICFLDLTEKEMDKIIQYTFEINRRRRIKGL